jgi:PilZ domain-containing protein
MGIIRMIERRKETRIPADVALTIWGVDTRGERFLQSARARDISESGALVVGLDADLTSGDVVGILYAGKKARFRVIWIRYDGTGDRMELAVHRVQPDACPWLDLLKVDGAVPAVESGTQPTT